MTPAATVRTVSPLALTAIGIFLIFGACMSSLAGMTLVVRGTAFDRVWALNPDAYRTLAPFRGIVGPLFLLLSVTMAIASAGWFKRRSWGWALAVGLISTQVVGDLVNLVRGEWLRSSVGITIAGGLLFYLLRPNVRAAFHTPMKPPA